MIFLRYLLERLRQRRLQLRVRQLAEFTFDPLATVYPQPLEWSDSPQRILLLTPHADDETFGAAGTLLRHIDHGDSVRIILFSDNRESIDDPLMTDEEKIAVREKEFFAATSFLQTAESFAKRLNMRLMHQNNGLPKSFVQEIVGFNPDVLYLPSLFDNHRDHRILNIWLLRALQDSKNTRLRIRGFEVWSPLPATIVSDITDRVEQKKAMMHCYLSQLSVIDYEHHILGLNAYRAITFGTSTRFAEAFLELTADAYLTLGNSLFQL